MASVQELLLAAQAQKSPLESLLEGIATGALAGVQRAPGIRRAQFAQQQAEAEQARKRKMFDLAQQQAEADQALEQQKLQLAQQKQQIAQQQAEAEQARKRKMFDFAMKQITGSRDAENAGKLKKLSADASGGTSADPGSKMKAARAPGLESTIGTGTGTGTGTEDGIFGRTGSKLGAGGAPGLKLSGISVSAKGEPSFSFRDPSVMERPVRGLRELFARMAQTGEISLNEAVAGVQRTFPRIVRDQFGRNVRVTSKGNEPVSPVTISDDPSDALLKLRQAAPELADRFDKIWDQSYSNTNQDLRIKVSQASAAAKIQSILTADPPSQVGLRSLGFYFARMAGSNSQLSDEERKTFELPMAIALQVQNSLTKTFTGDVSERMRTDLLRLARLIKADAEVEVNKVLRNQRRRAKFAVGKFWSPGLANAFPSLDSLVVSESEVLDQMVLDQIKRLEPGKAVPIDILPESGKKTNTNAGFTAEDEAELQRLEKKLGEGGN